MGGGRDGCRVYLITPPKLEPLPFADLPGGGATATPGLIRVAAVQLRLKDVDDDDWRRAIDALRPVAQSRGVAFLLNDRADLVRATGCDGAHVGQEDMPARQARASDGSGGDARRDLQGQPRPGDAGGRGRRRLRGVRRVLSLRHQGGDALHRSGNPAVVVGADGAAVLRDRRHHAENCAPLVQAGADFLAVVGCVWNHPDGPAAGVRALNAAIAAARPRWVSIPAAPGQQ